MNTNEQQYLNLLQDVLDNGISVRDRTGVGTLSVFGRTVRFDLTQGFPLLTTKKVAWKGVISELLWFLEGSGDERRLAEIRYGKPRAELTDKTTIWSGNSTAPYWVDKAAFEGDLGNVYGVMWRKWPNQHGEPVDQLAALIEGIKKDPNGRRHLLNAWNAAELPYSALPPCHVLSQYRVINGKLSCLMFQRSCDSVLGIPFNIASYALLTHLLAQVCGLGVGDLIIAMGDVHIYRNHIQQAQEQLTRTPRTAPSVLLDPLIMSIDDFTMDSITLVGYDPHPPIRAAMAV